MIRARIVPRSVMPGACLIDLRTQPSFRCPRCGTGSYHPKDIEHGYCGRCHTFPEDRDEAMMMVTDRSKTDRADRPVMREHRGT